MATLVSAAAVMQGDLVKRPFARLIVYLYRKTVTGKLAVTDERGERSTIFLREGLPVFVDRPSLEDRLDRVLVDCGAVSSRALASLEAERAGTGKKLGALLEERGLIDSSTLAEGLRLQIRRKLTRLFAPQKGSFEVYVGEHEFGRGDELEALRIDPPRVVYPGIRSVYDEPRLGRELAVLAGHVMALAPAPPMAVEALDFLPTDATTLAALRRGEVGLDAVRSLGARPFDVMSVLLTLLYTDMLAVRRAESSPSSSPDAAQAPPPEAASRSPLVTVSAAPLPPPSFVDSAPATAARVQPASARETVRVLVPAPALAREVVRVPLPTPPPTRPIVRALGETPASVRETVRVPPAQVRAPAWEPVRAPAAASGSTPASVRETVRVPPAEARAPVREPVRAPAAAATKPGASDSPAAAALRAEIEALAARIDKMTYFELLGIAQEAKASEVEAAYLQAVKRLHPDRVSGLGLADLRARVEVLMGRITEARTVLTDPHKRGQYLNSLKWTDEEKAQAQNALEAELQFQAGEAALRKGDFVHAEEGFAAAVKANPDEPEHAALLAWARFSNPKRNRDAMAKEAIKALVKALDERPRWARGHHYVGLAFKHAGDLERAERAFSEAMRLDAGNVDAVRELRLMEMRRRSGKKR